DSGDDLASIVARLNAWQPQMLIAYASMLRLLIEEQLAGRLGQMLLLAPVAAVQALKQRSPDSVQFARGHERPAAEQFLDGLLVGAVETGTVKGDGSQGDLP
ncbi:MAG: hypothetical protein ACLGIS_10290, partial [Actinomycetes bacterium]